MGLIMLVLIGIVPAAYALDMRASSQEIAAAAAAVERLEEELSEPEMVAMMEALKARHLAEAQVQRIARRAGVAAAEVLEGDFVEDGLHPAPHADVVLATLDPLPLAAALRERLDGRTDFADLSTEDR